MRKILKSDTLGGRLRQSRIANNKRLAEVRTMTCLSVSFLSDLERDRAKPSLETLQRLARCYGVSVATLLGEEAPAEITIGGATQEAIRHIVIDATRQRDTVAPPYQHIIDLLNLCIEAGFVDPDEDGPQTTLGAICDWLAASNTGPLITRPLLATFAPAMSDSDYIFIGEVDYVVVDQKILLWADKGSVLDGAGECQAAIWLKGNLPMDYYQPQRNGEESI